MMKLFIRAHDLGVRGEENIAARLGELGMDGVQLVTYKCLDGITYTPGSMTRERAEQFRRVFEKAGKSVPLIGAYFNPVHPDENKIKNGIAVFRDHIALAKTLGADRVGSETGSYNGDKWIYHPQNRTEEAVSRVADTFSELADYAQDFGVNVCMEGAFGHVCWNVAVLDKAVKRIGRKNIMFIFDLYNYLDGSNVNTMYDILNEGLQTFGDRICVFHIKDCVINDDGSLKQCPVGKGIFDYDRILTEIAKVCPDANLVFEGTTDGDIAPSAAYIRQFMR